MKYANHHRSVSGHRSDSGRSGRLSLSPYSVEDVAFTPAELERVRSTVACIQIVAHG